MPDELTIRRGTAADAQLVIELMDEAVRWLVARGQVGQWGTQPFAERETAPGWAEGIAGGGGLRVAELGGRGVGALAVGERPAHVAAIDRHESYIQLLVSSRREAGRGIGGALVSAAIAEARAAGCDVVRVDCWAGAPPLVGWYRAQGFDPSDTFELNGWRGQVFELPLR